MFQPKQLAIILLLPLLLQAGAIGLSVPINITENERISYTASDRPLTTYEYKPSVGLGFVFDTNVGKDKDFSYRLNLEYSLAKLDSSSRLFSDNYSKHKYSVINTFGLSVYHSKNVRFWVGPRVLFQWQHMSSSSNIRSLHNYGIGLAAATGVNVMLSKKIALGLDVDYHGVWMLGGETYSDYDGATIDNTSNYSVTAGTNKGLTARLYLFVRFGEQYEQNKKPSQADSVIDTTL